LHANLALEATVPPWLCFSAPISRSDSHRFLIAGRLCFALVKVLLIEDYAPLQKSVSKAIQEMSMGRRMGRKESGSPRIMFTT
jgi:hypothetical protein